jgi:hypothetical protein
MATGTSRIELRPFGSPRKLARPFGFETASISVGFHGDAIRLLVREGATEALRETVEGPGKASFPKTQTDVEYSSIISISGHSETRDIILSGMTATFPIIELLPDNEILTVAPRCQRYADGSYDINAKVYDHAGVQKREFLLGDGISHVQTDAEGNIWVGYFDEGVYGNFGWDTPIGAAGLSCFTNSGRKIWDYRPPEGFEPISDCYALNVSASGVWCYYYTGFPIALVDSHWRVHCWNTESSGGHAFAIGNRKVLMYGGYGDRRIACNLLSLDDHDGKLVSDVSLVLPREVDPTHDIVIGKGKELHVFLGDDWFVFSIDSLV